MIEHRDLKLIPDWPRLRELVARNLETSEENVEAMRERGDSLDRVQLAMAIEEVLEKLAK
jgi:hypothetical protein